MIKIPIRIEGVYDESTLQQLINYDIHLWSFDFRPLSFNFLQQYKFLELMNRYYNEKDKYFLHYEGERDYVIQKMIDDLELQGNLVNFFLEFSGREPLHFMENFSLKFVYNLSSTIDLIQLKDIICSEKLYAIVIHDTSLISQIKSLLINRDINLTPVEIFYSTNWSVFSNSIIFDNINVLSLPINDQVESQFRTVSAQKLEQSLNRL